MRKLVLLVTVLVLAGLISACIGWEGNSQTPVYTPTEGEPPIDMTWISPGKVMVTNFYPGATAEYPITVHNGNDYPAAFTISYRFPDNVDTEYEYPPQEAQDWVIIADPTPVIAPYDTENVTITLNMPKDADAPDKWEFWISVKDATQVGMIQTELCTRWLIEMR